MFTSQYLKGLSLPPSVKVLNFNGFDELSVVDGRVGL